MWRALFLAVGIYMCILGAECLVVDRFVMAGEHKPPAEDQTPATLFGATPPPPLATNHEIQPAEWAPWSFLSAGAVVILYALTINRQG
jgi:hypothetical protein